MPRMSDGILAPILASVVFLMTYVGILSERVHRTLVAVIGASVMIVVGTWLRFYSDMDAFRSVDYNTIALLFGMMILVGVLQRTGLFVYIAIAVAKLTRGRPVLLAVFLGALTAVVSSLLDNVTTMIIIAPVTLSIAAILEIDAVPLLLSEVLLSNIGGVSTMIGDPPNMLIGSAAHMTFTEMFVHLAPIALASCAVGLAALIFIVRRAFPPRPQTAARLASLSARKALEQPRQAIQIGVVLAATLALYFVHAQLRLGPGIVALIGASATLLWIRPSLEEVMSDIHWDVLVFFIGLFVIVGGIDASGALGVVARGLASLTRHGLAVSALVLLWGSAFLSAIVDNVPLTMAMIPILLSLEAQGVHVMPLWWALAVGVGFGGNATPVGSSAGVVTLSLGERGRTPIRFRTWLRYGLPVTLVSCVVGSAGILLGLQLGWL